MTEFQFGAEFALFLVAIAGLGLAVFRSDVVTHERWVRLALAGGFAALAMSAFVHGSLLRASDRDVLVVVPGIAGAALAGASGFAWTDRRSRWILAAAIGALALGLGLSIVGREVAAASVRGMGAACLGMALLVASRRAIATRVAATAAATLMLAVLVLGVGLALLLQRSVKDEAIRSLQSRAQVEQTRLADVQTETLRSTRLFQTSLIERRSPEAPLDFASLTEALPLGDSIPALAALMQTTADEEFARLPVAYVSASGVRVRTPRVTGADLQAIVGSDVFDEALHGRERVSLQVIAGRAFVVAAVAVRTQTVGVVGAVISARPFDRHYLLRRIRDDHGVSLGLVDRYGAVNVTAGAIAGANAREHVVHEAFARGRGSLELADGQFIFAQPLKASDGTTVLVLVTSTPTTSVDLAQARLFRVFFVFALAGAVLALLLATVVGERIGGSIRRLTLAAGAMGSGDGGTRTEIRSDDEVGLLSAAFDAAADQETSLLNRLAAIVAGMGEALIAVDESGAITEFNAAAAELVGTPAEEARHAPLATVLRVEADDGANLTSRLIHRRGHRWAALATLTTEAGPVPIAVSVGPLRDAAGAPAGGVIVIRDLRLEREGERMKREFLSRLGHELRTPLTPIIGFATILHEHEMPGEKVRELSGEIVEYGNRQLRVIEMIEFFAALDAGLDVVSVAPVSVKSLVADVLDDRGTKETNITSRVQRGTPDVLADAHWLRRAIDELVDNAIKFSPAGEGVHVSAEAGEEDGHGVVRVAVDDRGPGMSAQQVENAFGDFTQGDESDTRAYGGLGLGLPFARRLVEELGGHVTCETTLGKGSKFTLHLRAVPTPHKR